LRGNNGCKRIKGDFVIALFTNVQLIAVHKFSSGNSLSVIGL